MTLDERKALSGQKLKEAQRFSDAAAEHWAIGDGMMEEAYRLAREVDDILSGRPPRSRELRPLPVRN